MGTGPLQFGTVFGSFFGVQKPRFLGPFTCRRLGFAPKPQSHCTMAPGGASISSGFENTWYANAAPFGGTRGDRSPRVPPNGAALAYQVFSKPEEIEAPPGAIVQWLWGLGAKPSRRHVNGPKNLGFWTPKNEPKTVPNCRGPVPMTLGAHLWPQALWMSLRMAKGHAATDVLSICALCPARACFLR